MGLADELTCVDDEKDFREDCSLKSRVPVEIGGLFRRLREIQTLLEAKWPFGGSV